MTASAKVALVFTKYRKDLAVAQLVAECYVFDVLLRRPAAEGERSDSLSVGVSTASARSRLALVSFGK